jgi:hypothetical protein
MIEIPPWPWEHKYGESFSPPRNIFVVGHRVVVDAYAFQLKVGVADVISVRVDSMLIGDHLPELEMI